MNLCIDLSVNSLLYVNNLVNNQYASLLLCHLCINNNVIIVVTLLEALTNLKSATHRYHKLIIAAKQKYYSSLIHSSSSNPRHLWRAVNSLLHRKSPSPLPTSIPSPSIADTFCSFFSDKISSL